MEGVCFVFMVSFVGPQSIPLDLKSMPNSHLVMYILMLAYSKLKVASISIRPESGLEIVQKCIT